MRDTQEIITFTQPNNLILTTMTTEKLVKNEVYYCVSHLISELSKDAKYLDELLPVLISDDWRTAIEEHPDYDEILDHLFVDSLDEMDDEYELRKVGEKFNVEPYQNEALEHWIVSDWLSGKLEERGEMVIYDFMDLTVWGRTCSGQHISQDYVIQRIAE